MIKDETWEARERPPAPRGPRQARARRRHPLLRGLCGVVALAALAGWLWWQQNGLSSETLTVPGAPEGFAGYRIAILTDIHGKEFGPGNQRLFQFLRD